MEFGIKNESFLTILSDAGVDLQRLRTEDMSIEGLISKYVTEHGSDALDVPLVMMDVNAVIERFKLWQRLLPTVEPWYAVKCNPNPVLVRLLKELGCNFDCATPFEMQLVTQIGHNPANIVYAHPTKMVSHIKAARDMDVGMTVFDNEAELEKIASVYPDSKLLIRLAPIDDSKAQCPMSIKFGAPPHRVRGLLERARDLGLNVIGVHFHVGSGCSDVSAYRAALMEARRVFDLAGECGFTFSLLDMGGGYPGDECGDITFEQIAEEINSLLPVLFPDTRVIAEPGRFFAMASCHLVTKVVSKAVLAEKKKLRYHLNDGLYGSFNCLLYDHAHLSKPIVMRQHQVAEEKFDIDTASTCASFTSEASSSDDTAKKVSISASIFGPTCDGFDRVAECIEDLPELEVGDLLIWPKMGAYTSAAATNFNGFAMPQYFYYQSC